MLCFEMRSTFLNLGLATLAAAVPAKRASQIALSNGFLLVAKVTDPSHDLDPSVNNYVLSTVHTGAALNAAVLSPAPVTSGRIFYENGTSTQVDDKQTNILTDGATPPVPFGLYVQDPTQPPSNIPINVGPGTFNTISESDLIVINGQGEGTYLACNATVPYYNRNFITLQYAYGSSPTIPENCAPIELVPQCTTLNELPDDAYASHEYAVEVQCYEDATAI
ncbi:prolyl tripeptidyl peptidase [Cladorrhinum sp. PSN259]|nr:prolyl tripeptidyl peptidase [Cladorrhinum sp. PSN259]